MNRSLLTGAIAGATWITLAACGKDAVAPSNQVSAAIEAADVAATVGDAAGEDVNILFASDASFGGGALGSRVSASLSATTDDDAGSRWGAASNCTFSASTGRFTCPTATHNNLTLDRSFAFFDASNTAQSAYDPQTTAKANFQSAVAGTVAHDGWTAAVRRNRDFTVTGLAGTEIRRTWNGTGSGSMSGTNSDNGVSRTYTLNTTSTLSNVLVALPRVQNPWPLSGTANHTVNGTRTRVGAETVSQSLSRSATITFNGTSIVPLDVGDKQMCLNLATGKLAASTVTCR